jgi:hypothetical protein
MTAYGDRLQSIVSQRAHKIFARAEEHSRTKLRESTAVVDEYLRTTNIDPNDICVIAVGSIGRLEALESSDMDLIPILRRAIDGFEQHDRAIREAVERALKLKVSKGQALTKFETLEELSHPERIGGERDDSNSLTKRVLILTEGAVAGGKMTLDEARTELLNAYATHERTAGRHLLSLSNDVARYYRTLCIEYKAKVDVEGKDWCTRNVKLRHSRKFWYFSTMLVLAAQAKGSADGPALVSSVLTAMGHPPHVRLLEGLGQTTAHAARRILEPYAWFLDFMAKSENRIALANVTYGARYEAELANPFPAMKANSDLMHREMINLLDTLDRPTRDRVLDWFLL